MSRPLRNFILLFALGSFLVACGGGSTPTPNQSPTITSVTANPGTAAPGQASTITVVASDPDGDTLTYSYSATNGTVSGTSATATFLAGTAAGTATVNVTVSDGKGGTATSSVNVVIELLPPEIKITKQDVQNTQGNDCVLFFAVPQEEVRINSVTIINPISNSIVYNVGGTLVVKGQPVALQDSVSCYTKLSGEYQFTFTGERPGGPGFSAKASYTQP